MTVSSPAQDALAVVDLIREDRFEELQRRFLPMLRGVITAPGLRDAWRGKVARYGALETVGGPTMRPAPQGMVIARVPLGFERAAVTLAVSMLDGRLANIAVEDFAPAAPED